MSAADERELVDAVLSHTVIFHKTQDTPEFRERIRQAVRDEAPVG